MTKDERKQLEAAIAGEPLPQTMAELLQEQLERSFFYRRPQLARIRRSVLPPSAFRKEPQ